jgi:hypothetical protein
VKAAEVKRTANWALETAETMGQDLEDEGRRLQKRTQPYRASLKQTSDFEPNKESEENTSLEQTSDFEPNEESEEDMSASESVNKHQYENYHKRQN